MKKTNLKVRNMKMDGKKTYTFPTRAESAGSMAHHENLGVEEY